MSNQNDISDLTALPNQDVGMFRLPIRSEKIIVSIPVADEGTHITAALPDQWQYMLIRIPGRGVDGTAAYYQFLINPSYMTVTRNTLEAQSLSKAGWQFGLWGEDFVSIQLEGKTPGKYWNYGLTDLFTTSTASYRNLEALEVLFESNGYWFEGEEEFGGPLNSQQTHHQIKLHQDVELMVGEFIWSGMFESLSISEDAEKPHLMSFTLVFTAWNERYRDITPYRSPITGQVQRGHVPTVPSDRNLFPDSMPTLPSIPKLNVVGPKDPDDDDDSVGS